MAGSMILATAMIHEAVVWTKDDDFKGLQGVKYLPSKNKEAYEGAVADMAHLQKRP